MEKKYLNQSEAVRWLREQGIPVTDRTLINLRRRKLLRSMRLGDSRTSTVIFQKEQLMEDLMAYMSK